MSDKDYTFDDYIKDLWKYSPGLCVAVVCVIIGFLGVLILSQV